MPLILAGLAEHHKLFREVSHNPALTQHAIDVNPDAISLAALRDRAWQVMLPNYLERLAGLVEKFGVATAGGHGTDVLTEIAAAASAVRIATLLIEADRVIPGRIDAYSGALIDGDLKNPEMGDLLDDCGERVLKARGDVVIVPAERMPTQTGAAAIYRYQGISIINLRKNCKPSSKSDILQLAMTPMSVHTCSFQLVVTIFEARQHYLRCRS